MYLNDKCNFFLYLHRSVSDITNRQTYSSCNWVQNLHTTSHKPQIILRRHSGARQLDSNNTKLETK